MTVSELAKYIKTNKPGLHYVGGGKDGVHLYDDKTLVVMYTRHELYEFAYITDNHILECCEKAKSYEEHIELCKPLAMKDTETWKALQAMPAPKGRTKRRFR